MSSFVNGLLSIRWKQSSFSLLITTEADLVPNARAFSLWQIKKNFLSCFFSPKDMGQSGSRRAGAKSSLKNKKKFDRWSFGVGGLQTTEIPYSILSILIYFICSLYLFEYESFFVVFDIKIIRIELQIEDKIIFFIQITKAFFLIHHYLLRKLDQRFAYFGNFYYFQINDTAMEYYPKLGIVYFGTKDKKK
ncbi:hypothetical protein BpHYR1_048509 [Brachionus plicatilis]|uniref:Uncharacterized protein n=1 Tax=Brachionus plicatilis TaxID=10195 RepID=A0A3M7SCN9_BRAPC|nr:hypothetical protein BpHYR1_048509 [Brachionus plicatilis]